MKDPILIGEVIDVFGSQVDTSKMNEQQLNTHKDLVNNKIAAAAFDVYSSEPSVDMNLLQLPNFYGTPHIGGSTIESILAMGRSAINGLEVNNYIEIKKK